MADPSFVAGLVARLASFLFRDSRMYKCTDAMNLGFLYHTVPVRKARMFACHTGRKYWYQVQALNYQFLTAGHQVGNDLALLRVPFMYLFTCTPALPAYSDTGTWYQFFFSQRDQVPYIPATTKECSREMHFTLVWTGALLHFYTTNTSEGERTKYSSFSKVSLAPDTLGTRYCNDLLVTVTRGYVLW